ncbi:MAG: glutamyl-tRNA reductase, partial [Candidatus Contubernalis sp.]|nr:glutamyl-tRNA reductase [Candidatus Contubernalis sp.]
HLFNVAAGLNSMVLGETQILGQVKEAYQKSMEKQRVDTVFHALFRQALVVGKRVHRETAINDHPSSVSYVAVSLANQIFPVLKHQKVMVVGAGEMAQLTIKHLCDEGVQDLVVVNRSLQQAGRLVELFGGRVEDYNRLIDIMPTADIVISSTSAPHFILNREKMVKVMEQRGHKKIFLIDIAVPRDIDPEVREIPGVHLYNMDDLQSVLENNMEERKLAAKQAEKIISQETVDFQNWLKTRRVVPLITALRARAEDIRMEQLESALEKLKGLSDKEKKTVERLSKNIMNDLLRIPVIRLKEKATEKDAEGCIASLCELFNLDIEGEQEEKEKKLDRGL